MTKGRDVQTFRRQTSDTGKPGRKAGGAPQPHSVAQGDFSTLWRSCIGPPSQPKLASSLPNKRLSYCRLTSCGRNDDGGRKHSGIQAFRQSDVQTSDTGEPSCRDPHSGRSEESHCVAAVRPMPLNTSKQEGRKTTTATQRRAERFPGCSRNDNNAACRTCHLERSSMPL